MKSINNVIAVLLFICIVGMICTYKSKSNNDDYITFGEELERNKIIMIGKDKWDKGSQFVVKGKKYTPKQETDGHSNKEVNCELLQFSQLSNEDIYYLEKIATCEAGNVSIDTMSLVILVVLNRVENPRFPNSVYEVIMQPNQFSVCLPGGCWYYTEPNEKSIEAFNMVWDSLYDYSEGALYFESCINEDNWHSRNLQYLYSSDGVRFYK